jgi:hypothetical protein
MPVSLSLFTTAIKHVGVRFSKYTGPPSPLLRLFGRSIVSILQPRIASVCESLYPTYPERVCQRRPSLGVSLADAILRDSNDPGAYDIIGAGGKYFI